MASSWCFNSRAYLTAQIALTRTPYDRTFRRLISEDRLTNEDQWSEIASGKRYPASSTRNHDELSRSNTIGSERRYSYDDRSVPKADPRLDRVQSATYRDRRRRSTDEESSDRKVNAPGLARMPSSPDDLFEKVESASKRTSSLRKDVTLDDLERSSVRRGSRRSSFDSDVQAGKPPSRDVTSPKRTAAERSRLSEAQSPQKSIRDDRKDEIESRLAKREQQSRDVSRDREVFASRSSSQRREVSDDLDRVSAKRSSGRSSLESDNQGPKKISKETSIGKQRDENRELTRTISDPKSAESRQRSVEKDQRVRDSSRTVNAQQKRQDDHDIRRREMRRSQSQEDAKATKTTEATASSRKTATNESPGPMEIPKEEWACEHCTFINKMNDRVCVVCCKTKSSALPPSNPDNDLTAAAEPVASRAQAKSTESSVGAGDPASSLEKRTKLLKISNSEESGDSASVKNKGRPRRKISFSFGTKSSK